MAYLVDGYYGRRLIERSNQTPVVEVLRVEDSHSEPLVHTFLFNQCGFDWGNTGPGSRDLAYALLLDYRAQPDWALEHHRFLLSDFVQFFDDAQWFLAFSQVKAWVSNLYLS